MLHVTSVDNFTFSFAYGSVGGVAGLWGSDWGARGCPPAAGAYGAEHLGPLPGSCAALRLLCKRQGCRSTLLQLR